MAQYETGQNTKAVALVLLSRPDLDPPKGHIVIVEDRQKFLDLAMNVHAVHYAEMARVLRGAGALMHLYSAVNTLLMKTGWPR